MPLIVNNNKGRDGNFRFRPDIYTAHFMLALVVPVSAIVPMPSPRVFVMDNASGAYRGRQKKKGHQESFDVPGTHGTLGVRGVGITDRFHQVHKKSPDIIQVYPPCFTPRTLQIKQFKDLLKLKFKNN
ncbi:MAG: hypothetical protein GWM98_25590 [Nitrospinaceae bacterium]|nr:hypothetical protein [Nitrospinaceae bacterium]NIR57228.1 hypothetical protein [Nitrospinaceae bacterium]NIS87676.1 hypothetical protein [Nitrospinaceae bacterium]NIT84542.1 hypothetical protein [Nitrospinaceae bacterium]NIU46728.1 hypothetical protein [Nitrospinaceae bacterium]